MVMFRSILNIRLSCLSSLEGILSRFLCASSKGQFIRNNIVNRGSPLLTMEIVIHLSMTFAEKAHGENEIFFARFSHKY